jgi:alpha-1,3-mannosyltransferase
MFIVHVVRQFYPSVGGLETVVLELATAQTANGHAVRVVTLNRIFRAGDRKVLPKHDRIRGIQVIRLPFLGSPRYPVALSVVKHIRDADIVHVHGIDFFVDYLAWTKVFHRRKLVVSTHGGFFHTQFAARLKRVYFLTLTRLTLTWYSGVAAVSESDHRLFRSIRSRGMVCIENGVNSSRYHDLASPRPVKSILSIGRFAVHKRLDLLMLFVAALRRRDPGWTLKIAGRPWDLTVNDLSLLAENSGIGGALELIASPSEADIRNMMAGSSFIASASEYEGFGLTAIEGMSAGLIPLLSDIPPFRLLINKYCMGMVLDFGNANCASALLQEKWNDLEMHYTKYRQYLMTVAGEHAWSRVSCEYQKLYEATLGTKTRSILDIPIQVMSLSEAVQSLDLRFRAGVRTMVAFANAHALNVASLDNGYRSSLQQSIVFNDGIGVDIASLLLFGDQFPENLNGTDFVPHYLKATRNRYRIFLLGGRPGVAESAARRLLQSNSRHAIVGCLDGYLRTKTTAEVNEQIRKSQADFLLVGMGNPKQELWLMENLESTGCQLGFGVGALFDFLASEVSRAPQWIRSMRLEWTYRLSQEPRRLWRRYLVGNPTFMTRVTSQWWSGART